MRKLSVPTEEWRGWVESCLQAEATCPAFFKAINSEALITETFAGRREQPIQEALGELEAYLAEREGASKSASEMSTAGQSVAASGSVRSAIAAGSRQ